MSETDVRFNVLEMIEAMHHRLEREHKETPSTLFGRPTPRHHQILGASRALAELHGEIIADIISPPNHKTRSGDTE